MRKAGSEKSGDERETGQLTAKRWLSSRKLRVALLFPVGSWKELGNAE